MDKFWERYITTRQVNTKGAFDELVKMNQEPRNMNQGGLVDDLEPGALKDELLNDFDPFQETYEEYLQRKRLGERPFNMAEGGQLVKPSVDGSRPGYQGKDYIKPEGVGNPAGTIFGKNLQRLENLKKIIESSNSNYKKTITATDALKQVGWKNGWQSIGTKTALREEVKKILLNLNTTVDKMNNYVDNVMFAENALVKNFQNPGLHLQKKFGVSVGTVHKWKKQSQVYKDNKKIFDHLSSDFAFDKYKLMPDGTPRLMSDFSVIIQNKLPSVYGRGSTPENFIMNSAYRHYMQSKALGKTPNIFFIGNPELQSQHQWKFIKDDKLFSTDPSLDVVEFQGKPYKNNYLNHVDAAKLYEKDFGKVYKMFDELENKYMKAEVIDPKTNKPIKLDTLLRRQAYDLTGKKGYLLRRFMEIDHGDILNKPFDDLRLMDRTTNVAASNIKRQPKYKNNPELLKSKLDEIGYNKKFNNTDELIKFYGDRATGATGALDNFWCGTGKAYGGRIGFASGSGCPDSVKQKNFLRMTNDVAKGKITGEAAEQIAKKTSDVVAKAGSKSALTKILGPAGIGIDVIYEVASVGTDIYGGKPWKVAVQDNWIAGAFMPGTSLEEFHKAFFKKHPEAKAYGSGLELEEAYNKKLKEIERLKASDTYIGKADAAQQLPQLERDLEGIAAQYDAKGVAMEPGSPEYEAYMAAKTEYLDARKATSAATKAKLEMELNRPTSDRAVSYQKGEPVKMDFSLPGNYTTFEPVIPSSEEVDKFYTKEGYDLSPEDIDYVQKMEKWRQLFYDPENRGMGIRGTQDWRGVDKLPRKKSIFKTDFAGGGMVGIRKPSAIPPESGPQSQGLASLKKYGSYY